MRSLLLLHSLALTFPRGQTRYLVGRALRISCLHTRHVMLYKRTDRVKSVQNPFEALDHRPESVAGLRLRSY